MEILYYYNEPQVITFPEDDTHSHLCCAIDTKSANFVGCLVTNATLEAFKSGQTDLLSAMLCNDGWGLFNIADTNADEEEIEYLPNDGPIPQEYLPEAGFFINQLEAA